MPVRRRLARRTPRTLSDLSGSQRIHFAIGTAFPPAGHHCMPGCFCRFWPNGIHEYFAAYVDLRDELFVNRHQASAPGFAERLYLAMDDRPDEDLERVAADLYAAIYPTSAAGARS